MPAICHSPPRPLHRRTACLFAGGAAVLQAIAGAPAASAQEFDCRAASTQAEHAICGSGRLSSLDERMTRLYTRLWDVLGDGEAREGLRDYQRMFLAARDRCGRNESCIKGAYLDQFEVLESRLRFSGLAQER